MPQPRKLAGLVVSLVVVTMAGCFLGCIRQFKPVPIDEAQVPDGVKELIEEELGRRFTSVKDLTWYVLDECDDGLFVIATCRGNPRYQDTFSQSHLTYYVFGHLQQVQQGDKSTWEGVVDCNPLLIQSFGPIFRGTDFGGEIIPAGKRGVYAAGWAADPRMAEIVLVRADGQEFSCIAKNGFWWTGPHRWGGCFPDKAIVYDKSGKILYEGIFPPRFKESPWR